MRLNLNQSLQTREVEYAIKAELYKNLIGVSHHEPIRLTGFAIGIASGALTIASRVGLIFENFIKGLINIAGSPFSIQFSAKRGFKQLLVHVPGHLVSIPYTLFCACVEIPSKTWSMAKDPERYCAEKYSKYADKEDFI